MNASQRKPPRGQLSDEEVRAIRQDLREIRYVMKVARKHGRSRTLVEGIRDGLTYQHVKDQP